MAPSDTIKKVFISHASEDHDLALAVCEALESAGIGCWIAPRDIPGGKHWGAEIVQVIQSSSVLLLLFSEHADASTNVQSEVMLAHRHHRIVLPLRLEDAQPHGNIDYVVNTTQWLDLFPNPPSRIPQVIKSMQRLLAEGGTAPAAPPFPRSVKKSSGLAPWIKTLFLLLSGFLACYAWMQMTALAPVTTEQPPMAPAVKTPAAPVPSAALPSVLVAQPALAPPVEQKGTVIMAASPISEHPTAVPTPIPSSVSEPAQPNPVKPQTETLEAPKPPVFPPHEDKGISYALKTWERQGNQVTFWISVLSPHQDGRIQFGLNSIMLGENDQTWQNPLLIQGGEELSLDYALVNLSAGIPTRLGFRFRGIAPEVKVIKTLRINLSSSTSLTPIVFEGIPLQ